MQSLLFGVTDACLFGSEPQRERFEEGLARAVALAGRLGIPNLVMGSPANRAIPNSMDRAEAEQVAIDVFRRIGDLCLGARAKLALEPNAAAYGTNFLNTIGETLTFVQRVGHPAVSVNFDIGSLHMNGEMDAGGEYFAKAAPLVSHVHISEPNLAPAPQDVGQFEALARAILAHGYGGWFSIEMRAAEDDNLARVPDRCSGLLARSSCGRSTRRLNRWSSCPTTSSRSASRRKATWPLSSMRFRLLPRLVTSVFSIGRSSTWLASVIAPRFRPPSTSSPPSRACGSCWSATPSATIGDARSRASEAIGDVVVLTSFSEMAKADLLAFAEEAMASNRIVIGHRAGTRGLPIRVPLARRPDLALPRRWARPENHCIAAQPPRRNSGPSYGGDRSSLRAQARGRALRAQGAAA